MVVCASATMVSAPMASATTANARQSAQVADGAVEAPVTGYSLPPDLWQKAHHLGEIEFWGEIGAFVYSVAILLAILKVRVAPRLRDYAERVAKNRLLQAAIFTPPLMALIDLLSMPVDAGEHWVARRFNLSVQGWASWISDWAKSAGLEIVLAIFVVWILFACIRKSPRRWWLWFWAAAVPLSVMLVFLQPVVVDPMFHTFEPLAKKDAPLAAALEGMVQRTGEDIPVGRMYWMGASEKSNELNAYVTGIGASKRIVVWDTTIARLDTPQTVFVVGHEMGHYVLNHIPKGIVAGAAMLFALFYAGYRALGWLLGRRGARWEIRDPGDWAALPALLLILTVFSFASSPLQNAFSRHIEHQADQYGLEVTHGLTPNASQVAAQSFEALGKIDLEDPAPNPVDVFMFYSHPKIGDRIRFALEDQPWAHGGRGEFVP
jgi:Zn-dependent protease with chaperone function